MPHHKVIDDAPKCTVAENDVSGSSFSRRLMPNMRDRDLAIVPRDAHDGRGELFEGGSRSAEVHMEASENQALQDLQTYAQEKPRETTATIRNCLRVAEETKEAAGRTMEMLHCQGDQILRTHETAVTVDRHLTVVEILYLLNHSSQRIVEFWSFLHPYCDPPTSCRDFATVACCVDSHSLQKISWQPFYSFQLLECVCDSVETSPNLLPCLNWLKYLLNHSQ